jgi:D-lactate dehydrogenase (cytochrome)
MTPVPTHRLGLEQVLSPQEANAIDAFGKGHRGVGCLSETAEFLQSRFSLDLVLDQDIIGGFATDSSNLPGKADALCRPTSERECAIVFRTCFRAGIPYTISAGRSNLTGSATPDGGVLVSTVNMLEPEVMVDASAMTVRAPVGMILEDLRNQVLEQSGRELIYPVNPTSRTDAAVGGAVACNASGFTPGDIGATRAWVASVDFLFPDGMKASAGRGQVVSEAGRFVLDGGGTARDFPVPRHHRPAIKNAGGPFSAPDGSLDFVDLVVGSEGMFGLVTACTLKLEPRPRDYLDLFFSLPEEANALAFADYLRATLPGGVGTLSALEYFGIHSRKYMDHEEKLFRGDNPVAVYVQAPLKEQRVDDAAEAWFEILLASDCGLDEDAVMLLDNDRDRAVFLEARHSMPANSLEVVQHRGTYTIMTDTVVPPERFPEFLAFTHETIRSEGMDYLSFGHLGDCHLHFQILPTKEQLPRGAAIYDEVVAKSADLGGIYSGEHGTGKRKRADFLRCYGPEAVEGLRQCKAAVDPEWLLNRGNVIEPPGSG